MDDRVWAAIGSIGGAILALVGRELVSRGKRQEQRQRRMQSLDDDARKYLRTQLEELRPKVEGLIEENAMLRAELTVLKRRRK